MFQNEIRQRANNLKQKLKETSYESLQQITTHGIPNLFKPKPILVKIIWLILTVVSAGFSFYCIRTTVKNYLEYNVATQVRLIDTDNLDLPNVIICNKNQISSDESINNLLLRKFLDSFGKKSIDLNSISKKELSEINIILKQWSAGYFFYKFPLEETKRFTKPINETLIKMHFNGDYQNSSLFEWIFNINYGNCYRLNMNEILKKGIETKSKGPLVYYGVYLNLYLGQMDILDSLMPDKGIILSISDNTTNPFDKLSNFVDISGGSDVIIKLYQSTFKKYPRPYSNCDFDESDKDDEVTQSIQNTNKYYIKLKERYSFYSKSMCIEMCKNEKLMKLQNCTYAKSSIKMEKSFEEFREGCLKKFEYKSDDDFMEKFEQEVQTAKKIEMECGERDECPLECEQTRFDTNVVINQYGSVSVEQAKIDMKNKSIKIYNESRLSKDLISISIYFGSMSFYSYKEEPLFNTYNLVSEIGGILGLFLGMSLLSFTEFVEIILSTVFVVYEEKLSLSKKKKKIQIENNENNNSNNAANNTNFDNN